MEMLFVIDAKDYEKDWPVIEKTTVRAVIERDGLFACQRNKLGEYKIPGGGPDPGESLQDALIREVRDEMGFILDTSYIEPIGQMVEFREDAFRKGKTFVRHTFFYRCRILEETGKTNMTKSEIALGFTPAWADIDTIIRENRLCMVEKWNIRDTEFFVWLKKQRENTDVYRG